VRRRKAGGQQQQHWDDAQSTSSSSSAWGAGWLYGGGGGGNGASSSSTAGGSNAPRVYGAAHPPRGGQPGSGSGAGAGAWQPLSALGRTISNSSIVQKIRQAASQPALAKPQFNTFSDAADAVITSLATCGPTGAREAAPAASRGPTGSTVMQRSPSTGGSLGSAPRKQGGKSE
jgi:hypothetical protein